MPLFESSPEGFDHGELVVDILEIGLPAWFLRDAHASQATC